MKFPKLDVFTLSLWAITVVLFLFFLFKDKKKTLNSTKLAKGMMGGLLGDLMGILFLIGLILTFVPPETMYFLPQSYPLLQAASL